MIYKSLEEALLDLEKQGMLLRVKEEIDPDLEMAAVHLRMFARKGPALLFEKVKGSRYRAASNLFGDLERSRYLFRAQLDKMKDLVQLRNQPMEALKRPWRYFDSALTAYQALPKRSGFPIGQFEEIKISDVPLIKHWPMDGGAFVTLPQVYTEDIDRPGVMQSNLGMYRIQLDGNDYIPNKEIGLHYQIHRGIGVHQSKTNRKNQPLRVSIFVGGPPSHTLAAVMPLPEGISELGFAGGLGGRRFRYAYHEGHCISLDADFIITGEVLPNENKMEGPFGDHLGYYSLRHPFPLMRVHKVYAKRNAIWPFTVVGRPPQEDTAFGALIHEISGSAIPQEIPGVKEIHAVDAAGVHPLLLAVGSERYTPYLAQKRPAELLTQANRILGTGQLSLAKFLFIAAADDRSLNCHDIPAFLQYIFERVDLRRDLHFQTKTTIDTLDYSGEEINSGSKLVVAACGPKIRELATEPPAWFSQISSLQNPLLVMPGVVACKFEPFTDQANARNQLRLLSEELAAKSSGDTGLVQLVLYDDFQMNSNNLVGDYLWITYTRCNPSHDVYGVNESTDNKHWGCQAPLIMDARKKPHHAPELRLDEKVENAINRFFKSGASLEKWSD